MDRHGRIRTFLLRHSCRSLYPRTVGRRNYDPLHIPHHPGERQSLDHFKPGIDPLFDPDGAGEPLQSRRRTAGQYFQFQLRTACIGRQDLYRHKRWIQFFQSGIAATKPGRPVRSLHRFPYSRPAGSNRFADAAPARRYSKTCDPERRANKFRDQFRGFKLLGIPEEPLPLPDGRIRQ